MRLIERVRPIRGSDSPANRAFLRGDVSPAYHHPVATERKDARTARSVDRERDLRISEDDMRSPFRENAAGEVEIGLHRGYALVTGAFLAVCVGFPLSWVVVSPHEPWAWVTLAVVGAAIIFVWSRLTAAGTLRRPLLTLGPSGLRHASTGLDIPWDQIRRICMFELGGNGLYARLLALDVKDPHAVRRRIHGFARVRARGRPPVQLPVSLVAATNDELASLVRRYWNGPVENLRTSRTDLGFDDVELDADGLPLRPTRSTRLKRSVKEWSIIGAIFAVLLLLIAGCEALF